MTKTYKFVIILTMLCTLGYGQNSEKAKKRIINRQVGEFGNTQWWIGLKGGFLFSTPVASKKYSIYQNIKDPSIKYEKDYTQLHGPGYLFGAMFNYNFWKNISITFAPEYAMTPFQYKNKYTWQSDNNQIDFNQTHRYEVYFLNLPLIAKFDILRRIYRPYIQAGIAYGLRTYANKTIQTEQRDASLGGSQTITLDYPETGVTNLFITSHIYLPLGVGFSYDLGNSRLFIETNYRIGLTQITNRKNRFSDERSTSTGDVLDDIKLNQLDILVGVCFPMKFLRSGYFKKISP